MALLATSALAACSSGATGMLPAGPQTQSLSRAPNRAPGSAVSGVGMHATVHTPNESTLLVGLNPATGQNPTGAIGRAHADDVAAPNPCPSGYSPGGTAFSPNGGPETVQCYPNLGGSSGGGGGSGCSSNVECGQPCYTGEGGAGCPSGDPRVATYAPEKGRSCDSSPDVLGYSNLPGGSSGWPTTVVNIFGLQDGGDEYGWIYQTANQDLFFQRNPAAAQSSIDWLTGFFDKLPFVQGITDYLISATTSPYQITGTQASTIESSLQKSGYKVHHCFTEPLPYTPPVD